MFICTLDKNKLQFATTNKNQNQKNINYTHHRNNLNHTKVISAEMYNILYLYFINYCYCVYMVLVTYHSVNIIKKKGI